MNYKHGKWRTERHLYTKWNNMLNRCRNPNISSYKHYGGRGITVCDRWSSFENFYEDMAEQYFEHVSLWGKKATTIERIDNDKGYSKENCRFATPKEQSSNRRNGQKSNKGSCKEYNKMLKLEYMNSEEFVQRYLEAQEAGKSITQFASSLNWSVQRVHGRVVTLRNRGHNLPPLKYEKRGRKIDDIALKQVIEGQGEPLNQ